MRKIPARKVKMYTYKIDNNTIDLANVDIFMKWESVLSPGASFGISYIYDRFVANVSASVGYVFVPKTKTRKNHDISHESYASINPDKTYNLQYNYFADIFYGIKLTHHT